MGASGRSMVLLVALGLGLASPAVSRVREGLHNGSFEATLGEGATRPPCSARHTTASARSTPAST